ncbi:MAG: MraY family glycosyltransferase [Planctomycetota bacterium]
MSLSATPLPLQLAQVPEAPAASATMPDDASEWIWPAVSVDQFLPVLAVAFLVTLLVTPLFRRLAIDNGIVDVPDARRKNHTAPVAYLGGIALFFGWLAGILLVYLGIPGYDRSVALPGSLIIGAAAITLCGLFDDVYGIRARVKIGGQLIAAAALASQNVGTNITQGLVNLIGLGEMIPGWAVYYGGALLIGVLVIGGCNALNLIDGMDGLAAGVTAIAITGFLIIAGIVATRVPGSGDATRIVMCLAILGAVVGFLPYNFRPASIFMGDAGSLLLGYLCVAMFLLFGENAGVQPLKYVTACLVVFALPILDSSLAIVRRKLDGKPIFAPDAMHLHHMLKRSGLSTIQAVLTMYGIAVLFATIGVTMVAFEARWRWLLLVFFMIYTSLIVAGYRYSRVLRARELGVVARREDAPDQDSELVDSGAASEPPPVHTT